IGPNGAGKTTLLSVVGADRFPSKGEVTILGEEFGKTDMRTLRGKIGRVDPNLRMLDWVNAEEAVLTGLKNQVWPKWDEWTPDDHAHARDLLDLVGCLDFAEQEIKTLSQGERQRIRIARALIAQPKLMLLDEPATGLDFPGREALLASIDELTTSHPDLPTIMVTHHLEELPTTITHVMLMKEARVLAIGEASEMLTSAWISECFGFPITVQQFDGRWSARAEAGWTASRHRRVPPVVPEGAVDPYPDEV
ncbi:MAG TPA: ATP-binding cassette domain-containing protein, partial [Thermomicrobiales bacterium]|nr:ATP-binding cassette domain-containing protein [Thermomicrobiales bacterium]